jgi:hypothetical protein
MTNKLFSLVAGAALLALAGAAYAGEPLKLSSGQMDKITAGGSALANAASLTFGELSSDTFSQTSTNVSVISPKIAVAQAFSQGIAVGGILFNAASISHTDTIATLP